MISILLATYNWPQALKLCLESLATQTDRQFEIIIADDGSTESTKHVIEVFQATNDIPITHLWQEDQGFRKTKILNQAIAAAHGSYLIFLDGDCIVQPDFVANHRALAQSGFLVTGSRVLLNEKFTQELLTWPSWNFARFSAKLLPKRLSGEINKYWPLKIKFGNGAWRDYKKFVWRRIKGCNMACWKSDAESINGFDETMTEIGRASCRERVSSPV